MLLLPGWLLRMPTQAELEVIADHRRSFDTLIELAIADLLPVWSGLDPNDVRGVQDVLYPVLSDLVALYASAASALGADWYDDLRTASDVPGRFRAVPGALPDAEAVPVLVRWGTGPLFSATPNLAATQELVEGGYQKLIGDADRSSVFRSINADRSARGWARQTTGKSCPFCRYLAGRGAVYSAETAGFASHNHCDCVAVPKFGDGPAIASLPYTPSSKFRTQAARDANNARLRQALAAT